MGVLAMLDMLDTHMPTMERDLLMLSQRLMLIPIFSMADLDMVLAMLDMPDMDMLDTHMPTMERDLPMLSQRLMLIPISSMEDMLDMDIMVLAMPDMDTHMPTTERDLLMLSQRLMLTLDTMDMPDLMPMDTEVLDTEDTTMDKSYTLGKNSTKQ